jgi:hypothetical protein
MTEITPLPSNAQPISDKPCNPVWYRYFTSLNRKIIGLFRAIDVTSGGGIVVLSLPTSDPHVEGQLWNSSGTVKVSAG